MEDSTPPITVPVPTELDVNGRTQRKISAASSNSSNTTATVTTHHVIENHIESHQQRHRSQSMASILSFMNNNNGDLDFSFLMDPPNANTSNSNNGNGLIIGTSNTITNNNSNSNHESFMNTILQKNNNAEGLLSHSPPSISESYKEQYMHTKRTRSGSISGRLRSASDLSDRGLIDGDTKLLLKDMIISGMSTRDEKLQSALDEYEVSGDTSKLEGLIQSGQLNHATLQSMTLQQGQSNAGSGNMNASDKNGMNSSSSGNAVNSDGDKDASKNSLVPGSFGLDLLNDLDFDFLTVSEGQRDRGLSFLNPTIATMPVQNVTSSSDVQQTQGPRKTAGLSSTSKIANNAIDADDGIGDLDFTNLESFDASNVNSKDQSALSQTLMNNSDVANSVAINRRDRGNSLASWMSSIGDPLESSELQMQESSRFDIHEHEHGTFMNDLADMDGSLRLCDSELENHVQLFRSKQHKIPQQSHLPQQSSTFSRNIKTAPNHAFIKKVNKISNNPSLTNKKYESKKKRQGRPPKSNNSEDYSRSSHDKAGKPKVCCL